MPIRTLLTLALTATLAACTGPDDKDDSGEPQVDDEICDNSVDDDGDGDVDCDDADCASDAACSGPTTESDCTDGADDDSDGDVDCDDADCADDPACDAPATETVCDDGVDDDDDGAVDCDDDDCAGDAACAMPTTEENCADGLDDDGDRLFDCDDDDCADDPACATPETETLCADELDDDGDGMIDCDDDDCAADAACAPTTETACADELDDDGDGAIDCEDSDCAGDSACLPTTETACADELDDDGDGAIDCEDSDCAASADCLPTSELSCTDGADDDADGATDCDDSECAEDAACAPRTCADGDLGSELGYGLAMGSTVGGGDGFRGSCNYSSSAAEDLTFRWVAPVDATYTVTTADSSYDTVMSLVEDDCATEIVCDDDGGATFRTSAITFTASAGESRMFLVDGYGASGDFVLSVYSTEELDCTDGLDEDGDGAYDCEDSDCASACFELDCDDGVDGDGDGAVDCDDPDCGDDLTCVSPCADEDVGSVVGEAAVTGSTVGAGSDFEPTCAPEGGAEDRSFYWTSPADAVYFVESIGSDFDVVIAAQDGSCSVEVGCEDAATGFYGYVPAGTSVVFHVDGAHAADAGDFVINVWTDEEIVCDDGGDEDRDGDIDCLDAECAGEAACDTSLADYDLGSATGDAVATGDTTGMGDEWTPSCGTSFSEDVVYAWTAPHAGRWTFDLSDSTHADTIMGIYNPDGSPLACNDDSVGLLSVVSVSLRAGQVVLIGVDGYRATTGAYSLAIYE